jgi:oxygen-dependent protoporphyrinogen oxidase
VANADESVGALVRRRLGDEAADALVAPLLGGLFAGDVDRLSVRATFPELAEWELQPGSLLRGARAAAARRGERPPMFLGIRGGLERLTQALRDALGDRVYTGVLVDAVDGALGGFAIRAEGAVFEADMVVMATPAFVTADLVEGVAPRTAAWMRRIPFVSTAVVALVYGEGTADRLPRSAGFVAPRGALEMTACSFVSREWPEDAFRDRAVVRCFVGAAGAEDALDRPDADLVAASSRRLAKLLGLPPEPEQAAVVRWPRAMPQYEVGHLDVADEIDRSLPPGVFVTGQSYRGVGVPDCVRDAERVALLVRERAG